MTRAARVDREDELLQLHVVAPGDVIGVGRVKLKLELE